MESTVAVRNERLGTAALLERLAKEGARDAWAELLELHGAEILAVARRLLRDPALADDACQDTLLQVRAYAHRFRAPGRCADEAARAWLLRVACRVSLNMLRSRRRWSEREARHARAADPGQADGPDERLEPVLNALETLPEKYREPVALHFLGGLDYERLGGALSCSPETAKMRVHRGLGRLRERLALGGLSCSVATLDGLLNNLGAAPHAWAAPTAERLAQWQHLFDHPAPVPVPLLPNTTTGTVTMLKTAATFSVGAAMLVIGVALCGSAAPAGDAGADASPGAPLSSRGDADVIAADVEAVRAGVLPQAGDARKRLLAHPRAMPALQAAAEAARSNDERARFDDVRRAWYAAHPAEAFRLSLLDAPTAHTAKDLFEVRVQVENISGMPLGVLLTNRINNLMDVWTCRVHDQLEKEQIEQGIWKPFGDSPSLYQLGDYIVLKPKETFLVKQQVALSSFNLAPGTYRLTIQYRFDGNALLDPYAGSLNEDCLHGLWSVSLPLTIQE